MKTNPLAPLDFILKVASLCNLNCSYCYVYNKGDETWRRRPALMPDAVFYAALSRIRRHCVRSGQGTVQITFHGGEPCLVGPRHFSEWCSAAREVLGDITQVVFAMQTNGTLLNSRWAEVLLAHGVQVGVSIDGPRDLHDISRVTHKGQGSHKAVLRGIGFLRDAGIPLQILSVIQLGHDGLRIHRHFVELGARSINYLLPDFTHDTIGTVRERYGATPCADYLMPILEDWWSNGTIGLRIGMFWHMSQLVLGGESRIDALGNRPFRFVFVEADGAIEGLDVLRVCREAMPDTGLNVREHDFGEFLP